MQRPARPSQPGASKPPAHAPNGQKPAPAKKPIVATGTGAKTAAAVDPSGKEVLVVYSKAISDELGIETLVGEYTEVGTNHEKKYFKRTKAGDGADDMTVYLYWWDDRDGADFAGWWFGDKVGGTQVWSRCDKPEARPPKTGWRIPWDGKVVSDLVVEPKQKAPPAASKLEAKQEVDKEVSAASKAEADERVQRATDRVAIAEIEATQALESARAMQEGDVTEENLQVVEELLHAQLAALTDANKVLSADVMDARKTSPRAVAALTKLSPRVRSVQASLAQEVKASKQLGEKKKLEAVDRKKRLEAEEKQMLREQADAKKLEEALPDAMEAVTKVEEMLDMVISAAEPLETDIADELTDTASAAIKVTEVAVAKAQGAVRSARTHLNQKVVEAKQYSPEARKVALHEFGQLQDKLNEMQKKTTAYMRIRKSFEEKLVAKKVVGEFAQQLGVVEVKVEEVLNSATNSAEEADVKAAEAGSAPVKASLAEITASIKERIQSASGILKEGLAQMQEKCAASARRLDEFEAKIRGKLEQSQLREIAREGTEKTEQAEEAVLKMVLAEGPLKALETLSASEASEAVATAKAAAEAAETSVTQVSSFLKRKLVAVKGFSEAARAVTTEELGKLQSRIDSVAERAANFRKEVATRETGVLLQEATQKVVEAEGKVQRTVEASEPLRGEQPEQDMDKVREASEQTLEAEKAAAAACAEARRACMAKQKTTQAKESQAFASQLQKLLQRMSSAQQELGRQRKVALQGEKLWKGKAIVQKSLVEMTVLEEEVEKAEILTTPLGDERPSNEHIREMDAAVNAVQEKLTDVVKALESAQSSVSGPAKEDLDSLFQRAKKAQEQIDEMNETTREQRERVACEKMLEEGRAKLDTADERLKSIGGAEAPYLKGIDLVMMPLEEAKAAVAECEAVITSIQEALDDATSLIKQKTIEVRSLVEVVSKAGLSELATLSKRGTQAEDKLKSFKTDTDVRKKAMLLQLSTSVVVEAEWAGQDMTKEAAAFSEQAEAIGGDISPEVAQEVCEKFGKAERAAQEKMEAARKCLQERQRELRAMKGTDNEDLGKLVARLNTVKADMSKAKVAASEHEQRFVARMLMQEANGNIKSLEGELEKVIEAAAPLLVEGGKAFVASSMAKMILGALKDYAEKHSYSLEALFLKLGDSAGSGEVPKAEILTFLEKLPELCQRADLAFSEEQRQAIYIQFDTSGNGKVTKAGFLELFRERYVCLNSISITDGFDVGTSKTVDKLEADDVVETMGEPRTHEANGMTRVEVRVLKDGTTGWVTMQGNQGKTFVAPFTAYAGFVKGLEKQIAGAKQMAQQTAEYVNTKSRELASCAKGPLAEAKGELAKLRPQVAVLQAKLDAARKRIEEAKKEHTRREELERRRQEEKKDRKAASAVLQAISGKVVAAEEALKALQEASAPFTSESDLGAVETPISIREAAKAASEKVTASVAEAKQNMAVQEGKVVKAARGPWFEAKQQMKSLKQRLLGADKQAGEAMQSLEEACETLVAAKLGQISSALRASIRDRELTTEKLFIELSGSDGGDVTEAAFGKCIDGLPGLSLTAEQKSLVFQDAAAGALNRKKFFEMVERYYKCVKEVAITGAFEIQSSTTLRKAQLKEVMEVLDGPKTDESLGVMRVKGRSLLDGTVGWITATGNHGTPFMQEVPKPYFEVVAEVKLQDSLASEGSGEVAILPVGEVLELLEGPKRETVGNTSRCRGKATKDGAVGWFTVKTKHGTECVKPGRSTYTCVANIALTDFQDITGCKVLRKLAKGETLSVLEGPVEDSGAGVPRIRVQAVQDSQEGWVTVRGNAGSVYVEEGARQYIVSRSIALQKGFDSSTTTSRMLEEGETLEVLEGPREEQAEAPLRVRGRASGSAAVGWATLEDSQLRPWVPKDDK